ncbi:WD40-repeat-containing domain protein [Calycina marina]|uniref:WD40-repeat-containing domain protein n=1 Tax=Calycina marina TaxID=1763456 RepID=A0A9P7YXB5_9HELO|nr:WD40-repeat-containing domain protein [Calycina marina]
MSRSTDPGHFFQTDSSEATRARRAAKSGNKNGSPIALQSKILNVIPNPFSASSVYVAESAGCVRRVDIESRDTKTVYRGPTAPVTSVAIGGAGRNSVFAGCWDKDIWSWDRDSRALSKKFKGHMDFVKVVICSKIGGKDCLISGGADAKIMVWDTATGERLHTLRDKLDAMMAVQDLAIDPEESTESEAVFVSSSSDPHIRRWRVSLESWSQLVDTGKQTESDKSTGTILEHETSVYKVIFAGDDESSDLWTASADGRAKCLSRFKQWSTEETYEQGDYVRAVIVTSDWAVTAGRNEDVKVWDRAKGKLRLIYDGHFEEITGLVLLEGDKKVVSVSIDGTVRTWGLTELDFEKVEKDREEKTKDLEPEKAPKKSLLTEEEEAELAELLDSDEE